MISPSKGTGLTYTMPSISAYKPAARSSSPSSASGLQFDQVNISHEATNSGDRFRRELVSRLVREVRTKHSTGDIARIKSQVQSGAYEPDAIEIAAKLLLEENSRANN